MIGRPQQGAVWSPGLLELIAKLEKSAGSLQCIVALSLCYRTGRVLIRCVVYLCK